MVCLQQVLVEQGLGKFCDPEFVRYTSREMQEALDMTQEEMDRAAHRILLQEKQGRPLSFHGELKGTGPSPKPYLLHIAPNHMLPSIPSASIVSGPI